MKLEDKRVYRFLDILLQILHDDDIHEHQGGNASEFFEILTGLMHSESLR